MTRAWRWLHALLLGSLGLSILLAGSPLFWGVPTERSASPVEIQRSDPVESTATEEDLSGSTVSAGVYLAGPDGRLFAAERTIPAPPDRAVRYCPPEATRSNQCQREPGLGLDPQRVQVTREEIAGARARSAINALLAGPTNREEINGVSTTVFSDIFVDLFMVAENPEETEVRATAAGTAVLNIAPDSSYTRLEGDNQRLATAQLVWTVTDVPGVETVRIRIGGQDVGVPADGGTAPPAAPIDRSNYASFAPADSDDAGS